MVRLNTIIATLSTLAIARGASTITTSLFGLNSVNNYVASVVGDDSSAITYAVSCTTGASCVPGYTFTFTEGSSTADFDYSTKTGGAEVSVTMACQLSGTTSAACDVTVSEAAGTISTAVTSTTTYTGSGMPYATVTVTGGVEKLVSATASSSEASSSADTSSTAATSSSAAYATGPTYSQGSTMTMVLFLALFAIIGATAVFL